MNVPVLEIGTVLDENIGNVYVLGTIYMERSFCFFGCCIKSSYVIKGYLLGIL